MNSYPKRLPNGINLHQFLAEFGVKVLPVGKARSPRPANVVYGRASTLKRLLRKDAERCRTVVACIQASNPTCFEEGMVRAVWVYIDAHAAEAPRPALVAQFRGVDIGEIGKRAHRLVSGGNGRMGKKVEKIATLLADRLLDKDDAA